MNIVKLDTTHIPLIQHLFNGPKFMGVDVDKNYFVGKNYQFSTFYYEAFIETYISGLKNYHAFGAMDQDGNINTVLGFYQSQDDSSWYWNQVRSSGHNRKEIQSTLDEVIKFNEADGRLKFYSMFPLEYRNLYRRLAFSQFNAERYDYFDEYYVPLKHSVRFTLHWQILYNRTLVPTDTIVRCTFLKQKYRDDLYNAGRL